MPDPSYRDRVWAMALDTVWRLWAELGVSGQLTGVADPLSDHRFHALSAIDLEPLLLVTPTVGAHDTRLLQETLDWMVANYRLVSAVRLRNLMKTLDADAQHAFNRFATTITRHSSFRWPGASQPLEVAPRKRVPEPAMQEPALLQLRLRATFGVSARAEILRLMLAEPTRYQSVAELATKAAYGKDNVADALSLLSGAGIVQPATAGNRQQYRLVRPDRLTAFVGRLPTQFPDWASVFRLVLGFMQFAETAPDDPLARAAEVSRWLREHLADVARVGLQSTARLATGEARPGDFEGWSLRVMREWAGSDVPARGVAQVTYLVNRLDFGAYAPWQGWILEREQRPRPIEMPEWSGLYAERPRSDTIISDDSAGAPKLAHAMFEDAFRRVGVDIGPYWSSDGTNQLVCRAFAEDRLWPIPAGGSESFMEDFLRTWYADRKTQVSGRLQ
jgi:hypothetical protein